MSTGAVQTVRVIQLFPGDTLRTAIDQARLWITPKAKHKIKHALPPAPFHRCWSRTWRCLGLPDEIVGKHPPLAILAPDSHMPAFGKDLAMHDFYQEGILVLIRGDEFGPPGFFLWMQKFSNTSFARSRSSPVRNRTSARTSTGDIQ